MCFDQLERMLGPAGSWRLITSPIINPLVAGPGSPRGRARVIKVTSMGKGSRLWQ